MTNFTINHPQITGRLRTSHHLLGFFWSSRDPRRRFQFIRGHQSLQTGDLSERQFTVICWRAPAWCINIVLNMPIHHRAARGILGVFWSNLHPAMMRGMLVLLQKSADPAICHVRLTQGREDAQHRNTSDRKEAYLSNLAVSFCAAKTDGMNLPPCWWL